MHAFEWIVAWAREGGGGHVRVHDSKIDLVPRVR